MNHVHPATVGMKRQVTRAGTGRSPYEGLPRNGQLGIVVIEPVAEYLVESEVSREHETVVRADHKTVGVWSGLASGIDAAALVLHEGGRLPQRAILADRQ